jgi:hypothetical protein
LLSKAGQEVLIPGQLVLKTGRLFTEPGQLLSKPGQRGSRGRSPHRDSGQRRKNRGNRLGESGGGGRRLVTAKEYPALLRGCAVARLLTDCPEQAAPDVLILFICCANHLKE